MAGFLNALRAELFVSMRSVSTRLIVLLPALIGSIQLLLASMLGASRQAQEAISGGFGSGFGEVQGAEAWGALVDAYATGLTLIGLILVTYAAWSFAGDKDSGVLRHLLIRRVSRRTLVLAKLVHVHMLGLLTVALMLVICTLTANLLWEFGPVVEDGYELIGTQEIREELLLGLTLAIVPLPAAIALGLLISVAAGNGTQAITAALGITLALDIFKGVMGTVSDYLYVSYLSSLIDESYLKDVSRLVRGFSDVMIDPALLQLNQWVAWPQMLLFVVLALILVTRKSV
jgi:ABC-type transport system involved in multi-copper enzyme maturation permease subunit